MHIAHLPLDGLQPEDAYALAMRVLTALNIDRTRIPYKELRERLKQLEYQPSAIQQAVSTWA